MDSLRKRACEAPEPTSNPIAIPTAIPILTSQIKQKREELFISRVEAEEMDKKLSNIHEEKFQKGMQLKKIFGIIALIVFVLFISIASYFVWKTYNVSRKVNSESQNKITFTQSMLAVASPVISKETPELKGEQTGRINLLLLGAAGEKKPGGNLTDTVMVMSINTKTNKVALLSLPRDFYAPISNSSSYAKINSLYPIGIKEGKGIELIKEATQKITGLDVHYYAVVNFDAFEKIVDQIGGINIVNERDIYDPTYPGPNYSYETFSLSRGFHNLDGKTALKYVRERHTDPEGDFGRAKRQQQVIQAVKNKMFSLKTLFNVVAINGILNTVGDNVKTDIAINELESFISLSKKVDLENISNVVVDAWKKDSLLKVSHVQTINGNAFILIPRVGNYSEIQEVAKNIFNQDEIKKRKEMIANENAKIIITNKSGDNKLAYKIKELLSDKLEIKEVVLSSSDKNMTEALTIVQQKSNSEKIFTLDELIKKLPAKLSSIPISSEEENDFIITLGSDLIEVYNYEEDKIGLEEFNKLQNDNNF